jgi:hypothetical protein
MTEELGELVSSWRDAERDHLPLYTLINSRTETMILMMHLKFKSFGKKMSNHFNFHLDPTILTTILKSIKTGAYPQHLRKHVHELISFLFG